MPRIRSIHPGFWTDEAVVSVSRDARLLFIGLWNQCDDGGVFEWKPIGLRLRIFPAEPVSIVPLLHELERANLIRGFEIDGKRYGVVRNFVIFQRPKRPRNIHPLPISLRNFSGLASESSEPVGNQWGNRPAEGLDSRDKSPPPYPHPADAVGGRAGRGNDDGEGKPLCPGSRADGTNPRAHGTNPRGDGSNPRALGTNPRQQSRNGFADSAADDMQEAIDYAEAADAHPRGARVVPIAGRAHRHKHH